jgi:predicted transposase YbfD/YdcC
VTLDAMGCQKEIAKVITEPGADYVLALKKNHRHRYDDVTLFLDDAQAREFAEIDPDDHDTVEGDHSRIETRKYRITSAIKWLGATASWAHLQSLGRVESRRESGEKVQIERRYYLVSLPADAKRFGDAVRQHWGRVNFWWSMMNLASHAPWPGCSALKVTKSIPPCMVSKPYKCYSSRTTI